MNPALPLRVLPQDFVVCRLDPSAELPTPPQGSRFWSLTITTRECSLVCEPQDCPRGAVRETGWRAIEVVGVLDFSLVGIIAGLSQALAEAGISIFVLSTYETDYLLVRSVEISRACLVLEAAGYQIIDQADYHTRGLS
jgi:hypothetical protein